LSRENRENWFLEIELKLKGKGVFYTCEKTVQQYAWIKREGIAENKSTSEKDSEVDKLALSFERIGSIFNKEKKEKYNQDKAKALSIMMPSLEIEDKEQFRGHGIAKTF
jgi:hypothetical protein